MIAPTHSKASELQDIAHRQVGGGTCFRKAFAECRTLMNRCSNTQDIFFFELKTNGEVANDTDGTGFFLTQKSNLV